MADDRCDELDFSPRIRFPEVIKAEREEIHNRRKAANQGDTPGRPQKLMGLALSGGGVRSATFNLGLLQALAESGKLKLFDYLSTVSGGGYVGGWWSAFLARDARDKDKKLFPDPEDIESERDDRRAALEATETRTDVERPQIKDSAINAAEDPIHHLRLFSNVMTPRKGLLSADTWRAIAVISRNLVMTWVVLLPILLAAIMIGQAWYNLAADYSLTLKGHLLLALAVPGLLFIGSVVCAIYWMLFSRRWQSLGDKIVVVISTLVFFLLTGIAITIFDVPVPEIFCIVFILWVAYVAARLLWWKEEHHAKRYDSDFWRNRLTNLQTKTLSYSVFALVIFLFAGFGHLIFDYLLRAGEAKVMQAGGWSAIGASVLSWIYTALKASPTGGGDNKPSAKPPMLQKVIFAIAPPTLLLVLGIVLSWIGDKAYHYVHNNPGVLGVVARGGLISASLFLVLALYEFRPPQKWKSLVVIVVWLVVLIVAWRLDPDEIKPYLVSLGALTLLLLAAALTFRAFLRKKIWIAFYAAALAILAIWIFFFVDRGTYVLVDRKIPTYVLAGALATLVLLLFELVQGRGANTRAIALTVIACTIFVLIGAAVGAKANFGDRALTMVGLIAIILGWVLAVGWLADPNSLTIHGFYKARLVRAYMGASNENRKKVPDADITDAVPGDDLLLTQLKNTDRGAPYHLINTMLNLVGGSDISTQARASDSFLMSKLYCGSTRTGYRKTSEYACGTISLGTAVAVSGAAAAPSMGAQTPSAALSALMTLFNIRLGYWAPTPNLSYWHSGAARLWPVYTLQELISQTTDLLPYCYLTDGGHYENTGVYSLIQRGCKVIVVGECGADPTPTLDDLGNLIRKVRIDFDTEVTFEDADIDRLRAKTAHVIVGKILYGKDHADALGLTDDEREGKIVVIKPNVADKAPVDVKQYGYLHTDFPQQFTFDLWYDEAQFESYRRLGEESGKLAATFI